MIDRRRILRMLSRAHLGEGEAREAFVEACELLLHLADARPEASARLAVASIDAVRVARLADRLARQVWQGGRLALARDEAMALRSLDPQRAARLFETALVQWPAAAAEIAEHDAPAGLMAQALCHLALLLPPDLPLHIGQVLRRGAVIRAMPRSLLAWALARAGVEHVSRWAERQLARPASRSEDRWLWVRDIVRQVDAPPPLDDAPPPFPVAEAVVTFDRAIETDFDSGANAAIVDVTDARSADSGLAAFDDQRAAASASIPGRRRRTRATRQTDMALPPSADSLQPSEQASDEFHFVLDGDHVRGATMVEHTQADLHFRYEVPSSDVLARVGHAALESARKTDLDIELQLTPSGAITIDGHRRQVARLRGGRLSGPVSFRLLAGAAPEVLVDGPIEHGVHVDFVVQGETVHQVMLAIQVQPSAARGLPEPAEAAVSSVSVGATPAQLVEAAALTPPPRHHVRLSLSVDASGLRVELDHLVDGADDWSDLASVPALDSAALAALALEVRAPLAKSYKVQAAAWQRFDGSVAAGDTAVHDALAHALECAAAAGAGLNRALRQDPSLARLLDHIEQKVPDGAVMTVTTDKVFLPWELMTPQHWALGMTPAQRAKTPAIDTQRFWGARFAIETKPRGVAVGERRLVHLGARPRRVSVNLNPGIAMPGLPTPQQPIEVHKAWAAQLKGRDQLEGTVNEACRPVREVLQDGQHHASLVYLYCHGQSANPFGGTDELLELDEECALMPPDLIGDTTYAAAPVIFLNACQSGNISPLAYSSFLKEFCRRGAIGLIATTHSVPITFGAHFGPELVGRYLDCQGSLAATLQALRREHLRRGNPVPLFYTLQCQLAFPA